LEKGGKGKEGGKEGMREGEGNKVGKRREARKTDGMCDFCHIVKFEGS